jgi:hypothetical protein
VLNFKREGTKVIAVIEANVSQDKRFLHFSWDTNDEMWGELLQENLQNGLRLKLEDIRRKAYESGWKDARGKRKRETWFSGWL